MRINCICCGHPFDLGDAYDDYDGPVRSMRPFVAFAQPQPATATTHSPAPAQQIEGAALPFPAAAAPPSNTLPPRAAA